MQTRTKYYIADGLTGLAIISAVYIVYGMADVFLNTAMNKTPEDFDEPWMWFGGMAFISLVAVFYCTILAKIVAVIYNRATKYRLELKGEEWEPVKTRPIIHDFPVFMAFMILTPYITQQVYAMMEGSSVLTFAVMSLVPALTCVCMLDVYQRLMAWIDAQIGKRKKERLKIQTDMKEALER